MDQELIREKVKKEILRNTLLKEDNILVDSEDGEIVLQGNVDSLDKKWLAEDIAGDTLGVLHVKNEIRVVDIDHKAREDFYEN